MTELELEGHTLGQKQRHYNKLVQDAVESGKTVNVEDFNLEDSDVINLMKIDVASNKKNVEYILNVLTCDDMMYVSRAIKHSDWLVNKEDIINPKYLRTNLFPGMCSKAVIKLVKYIKNNLNDEKRAEEFYYSEENLEEAVKWLPCCSLNFIQENIASHIEHIKPRLLRRLCEKSVTILEIYVTNAKAAEKKRKALQANMFLLSSHTGRFLDLAEANVFPKFNKKATTILMKHNSSRVIDNFGDYYNFIHLPTFVKCLKQDKIKDFLINLAEHMKENKLYNFCNSQRLLFFIQQMPDNVRFDFVKQVFIDKNLKTNETCSLTEKERKGIITLSKIRIRHFGNKYHWYQFAPFNTALQKIQELIGSLSYNEEKISMLELVLTSAQNDQSNERTFLEYVRDKERNAEYNIKEKILTKLILKNNFINYDISTWTVLDDICKEIGIYSESNDSEPIVIEAIVIYNIIHDTKVPQVVENKFNINSLHRYHKKLDDKAKEKIFMYLCGLLDTKLKNHDVTNEEEFREKLNTLQLNLKVLKDYKKELDNYPSIIGIIKDVVKFKNDHTFTVSLETLFNVNKTWRKLLFEESLAFCQSQSVLYNALKHDPSLLVQNKSVMQTMLCNDNMIFRQVLGKIKIYWPTSFAKNTITMYTQNLNGLRNHKAATRGLSILLPRTLLRELIEKYTPTEAKVDWIKVDEIKLSVQQQFAKNMHNARPQPLPETILQFAKGDYLQYALPSLLTIFYNLNSLSSQKYILKLLDAPVSLQKHGIRLAVAKLELEQLLIHFSNIWKNNKNASIRSVMFKNVFKILCKEKDSKKIKRTWELMELFIDNLTLQEDKAIFKILFNIEKVPIDVRAKFYMKTYNFLHRLIKSGEEYKDYEHQFNRYFTAYSKEIMEQLEPKFVEEIIFEYIDKDFTKQQTGEWVISIISSYLLCVTDEQNQLMRYEKVLLPILKQSFTLWHTESFIRNNLKMLLNTLRLDIIQYGTKKIIPDKMFALIYEELNQTLEIPENYMLLTNWKLTVTYIGILATHQPLMDWKETCIKVANEFGNKCSDYLREDCNQYFPRIYLLFANALDNFLKNFIPEIAYWDIYKRLICDQKFIQGYLAIIKLCSRHQGAADQDTKQFLQEMCTSIAAHPSTEVKIHYYSSLNQSY